MEASAVPRPHRLSPSPRLLRLAGDDRLVALIRSGNEAAFEVVYERYHRPLLSFSRHMLGNTEDAAEAVQQTFLSAYRDLTTSAKAIQLKAWLFTIARNRCLSVLRGRREHADIDVVEPATEGLAAEVQRREDLREMLGDLSRLPEDQRAALVLAEIGSLAHDEIGEIVGCSREKVKALVFQARSSLAASREARATSCQDIREQLATLRGGALRRSGCGATCATAPAARSSARRYAGSGRPSPSFSPWLRSPVSRRWCFRARASAEEGRPPPRPALAEGQLPDSGRLAQRAWR